MNPCDFFCLPILSSTFQKGVLSSSKAIGVQKILSFLKNHKISKQKNFRGGVPCGNIRKVV